MKLRIIFLAALPVAALNAQTSALTPKAVVSRIGEKTAVVLPPNTVDKFKAGDSTIKVTGITVTMMATLDVLKRAVQLGDNFVITHEPTFYSHRDTLGVLRSEGDSVLAEKERYISEHRLVVWRFHDTPHLMKPDMINAGATRALGWDNYRRSASEVTFDLPAQAISMLARDVGRKLGAEAIRISGDPKGQVSRVVFTHGFAGFVANRRAIQSSHPDVVILGEDHEWETIEYVIDAINLGRLKGLIVLGHIASEQAGMEEAARWLRTFVNEVPIHFVATREPFQALSR